MKPVLFIFLVIFVRVSSYAQDTTATASGFQDVKKNTVYFEALGNGVFYSVNYDRLISPNIAFRAGLSLPPRFGDPVLGVDAFSFLVPISASYLFNFSGTPSYFELGVGFTPMITVITTQYPFFGVPQYSETTVNMNASIIVPMLGYRLQPKEEGFNFRILYSPNIPLDAAYHASTGIKPLNYWFGVSLGHTF